VTGLIAASIAGRGRGFGQQEESGLASPGASSDVFGTPGHPVCFMHVGKVGGSAVKQTLWDRFDSDKIYNESPEGFDDVDPLFLTSFATITGHFSYKDTLKFPVSRFLFSMVRDPVDRVVSAYWSQRNFRRPTDASNEIMVHCAKTLTLSDYVESNHPQVRSVVENHQTKVFADDWRSPDRRSDRHTLDQALAHLHEFDLVGVYESYDHSMQTLCALLNWRPWPSEARYNVTAGRRSTAELDPAVRQRIAGRNLLDTELYDAVVKRFEAQFRSVLSKLVLTSSRAQPSQPAASADDIFLGAEKGLDGSGWYAREQTERCILRWLGPGTTASAVLRISRAGDLIAEAHVWAWTSRRVLDSLTLHVDQVACDVHSVDLVEDIASGGPMCTKRWRIPAHAGASGSLELVFSVCCSERLREAGIPDARDRLGSVGVKAIHVHAA
jgi:hypothetical protein